MVVRPARIRLRATLTRTFAATGVGGAARVVDQQLDVAIVGLADGLAVGLRVVVAERARDRGELQRCHGAAGVPGAGAAAGAALSSSVPNSDSVPSLVVHQVDEPVLVGEVGLGGGAHDPEAVLARGLRKATSLTCEWPATQAITCGCASSRSVTSSPRCSGAELRGSGSQPGSRWARCSAR